MFFHIMCLVLSKLTISKVGKAEFGGIAKLICMAKVQNFFEISPDLPFTEFDFYELYRQTFATSELGKIRKRLPLGEMAEVQQHPG